MDITKLINFDFAKHPWTQKVDLYCERINQMTTAEPFNLYSSLVFFVSAYYAYQFGKEKNALKGPETSLLICLLLIGFFGSLMHRLSNVWTMYLDTVPIYLFQILFVYFYSGFIARHKPKPHRLAMFITYGFITLQFLATMVPNTVLFGSVIHLPMLIFLLIFAYYHNHNVRKNSEKYEFGKTGPSSASTISGHD